MLDTALSTLYRTPHLLIISPNPIEAGPVWSSFTDLASSQSLAAHSGSLLSQSEPRPPSCTCSFVMTQLLSSLPSFGLWRFLFLEHPSLTPSLFGLAHLSMGITSESVLTPSPRWVSVSLLCSLREHTYHSSGHTISAYTSVSPARCP